MGVCGEETVFALVKNLTYGGKISMRTNVSFSALVLLGTAISLCCPRTASAATLDLSYSTTYDGSSVVTSPTPGTGLVNTPAIPGSLSYGHNFSHPTAIVPRSPSPGYGFYDDYVFTV